MYNIINELLCIMHDFFQSNPGAVQQDGGPGGVWRSSQHGSHTRCVSHLTPQKLQQVGAPYPDQPRSRVWADGAVCVIGKECGRTLMCIRTFLSSGVGSLRWSESSCDFHVIFYSWIRHLLFSNRFKIWGWFQCQHISQVYTACSDDQGPSFGRFCGRVTCDMLG